MFALPFERRQRMKRKMTLTLVLTASIGLLLSGIVTTVHGERKAGPVADTGIVSLSSNEVLRVTADWDGAATVAFRQAGYVQGGVNNGVYKLMLTSQSTSQPVTLMHGDAASIDIDSNSFGVRAIVLSSNPKVRVTAAIVDKNTGNIIAVLIGLMVPGPH
jgi:hypothetical protein